LKQKQCIVEEVITKCWVGFIDWLGFTLSCQQLHDDPASRDCPMYARARESAALANNIDHIIKSPPLMSRDAPVM
jgi:hypothetical protein